MGMRRALMVMFTLILSFCLARFARQSLIFIKSCRVNILEILITLTFKLMYRTVMPSLHFPFQNHHNNSTFHLLGLWKGISIFILSRIKRFYTV